MFYRIEGTGIKIAGIASSILAGEEQVPRWLRRVFDDADQVVFATDIKQIDPAAFLLPAHQSLTMLTSFEAVSALWKRLEIPGSPARLKPWFVSAHLRACLSGLSAPGPEPWLLAEARRRLEPPRFLDTPRDWLAAFDAVPLEEQLDQLEQVVASPEQAAADEVAAHEALMAHNLKTVDALLEVRRQRQPGFYRHCFDERNQRWLPGLLRLIEGDATARHAPGILIVIQAWHLCGPRGIPALLTGEGRTPTRLL